MRNLLRFFAVIGVVLAGWAAPPPLAQANNLDTTADRVLGQPNFTHAAVNNPTLGAAGLHGPASVALDGQGNLYVADATNNRVLIYNAPLSTGMAASRVIGQPSFITNTAHTSAAGLEFPTGVALDALGNLYVADSANNRVLEYTAPLSTGMAASRVFGQAGSFTTATVNKGSLGAASLYNPFGVALDLQGRLYVADNGNERVLEYDAPLASASANRVVGQPAFNTNDSNHGGLGPASLAGPLGLSVSARGDLYVADSGNNRVLEYDTPLTSDTSADLVFGQPDFVHSDLNHGGLTNHSLYSPRSVALDGHGNLYVVDSGNNRGLEFNTPLTDTAHADLIFGQPDDSSSTGNNGGITDHGLAAPQAVTVDGQGNVFIADYGNNRVLEYDQPVPHGAPALTAISPNRVAQGGPSFTLTVSGASFYGDSVVRWNGSPRPTTFVNSTRLTATISAADVASGGPFAVTVFTPAPGGGSSTLLNLALYLRGAHDATADMEQGQPNFGANTASNPHLLPANHLQQPGGLVVDPHSGRLFVTDNFNNRVLSWPNAAGLVNGQAADLVLGQPNFASTAPNAGGRSARSLDRPLGVALDGQGNLYVVDRDNNRVLEYNAPLSSGMAASHVYGQGGSFSVGAANNGGVSANSLNAPQDLALDAAGKLYVADNSNHRVLEYDSPLSSATANHVFGQPNFGSHGLNQGGLNANSLYAPFGLALDAAGNLYVADSGNNRVLEYNAPLLTHAAADRVFGQPNFTSGAADNGGINAHTLFGPSAVALDGWGNLYVADFYNSRVLEYDTPLTDGSADRVFGQPDFSTGAQNDTGLNANSLSNPVGVALDAQANLYVADWSNNRVLEYDWALDKLALPLMMR